MPTVKMLSLGGERLTPPPPPPKKKKSFGSLPAPRSGYATAIMVVFLLIYHKIWISLKSVHTFLSNGVHRQTNKQTNKQTDKLMLPKK